MCAIDRPLDNASVKHTISFMCDQNLKRQTIYEFIGFFLIVYNTELRISFSDFTSLRSYDPSS